MALTREQSIALYGTEAYTAWPEEGAAADARTKGLVGAGGVPGAFDYAAEANKAYGELGSYYSRLLSEYKGDMNKILARMMQDYETGIRTKREDTAQATTNATEAVRNNALARGLYSQSAYAPNTGYGLYDTNLNKAVQPIQQAQTRYEEAAALEKNRKVEDINTAIPRKEFELEQQRRQQSAQLANERGQLAYQKKSYEELYNPSLV